MRLYLFAGLTCAAWLPAAAAPIKLDVDRSRSYIVAVTRKGGLLSFAAGHDHGILATEWDAGVCFDTDNPPRSSARITIPTASLRIDTEDARQKARLKGEGPSPKDRQEIQEKMLGPENLDAQNYREIRFESAAVAQKGAGTLSLTGPLTIRGKTQTVSAPVRLERPGNDVHIVTGEIRIRQSDYGIRPASVGGVVTVKDLVELRFRFEARATLQVCE